MWETWVWSLGREDPLEKEMATHSSILVWKIPWTKETGRLQFMDTTEWLHFPMFKCKPPYGSFAVMWMDSELVIQSEGSQRKKNKYCILTEDPLDLEMAICSSILAWKIPWTEESGRPQLCGCKELEMSRRLRTARKLEKWQRWTCLLGRKTQT